MNKRNKKILQILLIYFVIPIGIFLGIVVHQFGSDGLLFVGLAVVALIIFAAAPQKSRRQIYGETLEEEQRQGDMASTLSMQEDSRSHH